MLASISRFYTANPHVQPEREGLPLYGCPVTINNRNQRVLIRRGAPFFGDFLHTTSYPLQPAFAMSENVFVLLKILVSSTASFIIALAITPFITRFITEYGKKETRKFLDFHSHKNNTPSMGGIIIWLAVLIVTALTSFLSTLYPRSWGWLNFLTRSQTYLPLGTLIFAALLGLLDDILGLMKKTWLTIKLRLTIFAGAGLIAAWWFHNKLEWDKISVPFLGEFSINGWYIPLFTFIIIAAAFSANETDGLDGLLGGSMAITFSAYTIIAVALGKYELAVFCAVITGALVAFLWFNIYPARFFMGDTGSVTLGITAGVMAMLTDTVLLLPLLMVIPFLESLSVILQIASVKLRQKKLFLFTPLHHHFEKYGWPETQITMRFWIINGVGSALALTLFFLDRQL